MDNLSSRASVFDVPFAADIASEAPGLTAPTEFDWNVSNGGAWDSASNWLQDVVAKSNTLPAVLGAAGSSTNSPTYMVTLISGADASVAGVKITDSNATLEIGGGRSLTLAAKSASVNDGTIWLQQTPTTGSASAAKDGALALGAKATLVNDATIEALGIGPFGGAGNRITGGVIVNDDAIGARSGGLILVGDAIDNGIHGVIAALGTGSGPAAGWVEFDNTITDGGELLMTGGGIGFHTARGSLRNVLDDVTMDAWVSVTAHSALTLEGAIAVNGPLALDTAGSASLLVKGVVTLSGVDEILVSGHPHAIGGIGDVIAGEGSGATLINGVTIQVGFSGGNSPWPADLQIGGGGLTLDNTDAISIDALGGTLTINTGANAISNTGVMQSLGNGAAKSESVLNIFSAVTGIGTDIVEGGEIKFHGAVGGGQTVEFEVLKATVPDQGGTLALAHAERFSATIEGLITTSDRFFDAVDLQDFAFKAAKITAIGGAGAQGATTDVTLAAGKLTETLHLYNSTANEYGLLATDYSLTSDGVGGTIFSVGAGNIGQGRG